MRACVRTYALHGSFELPSTRADREAKQERAKDRECEGAARLREGVRSEPQSVSFCIFSVFGRPSGGFN